MKEVSQTQEKEPSPAEAPHTEDSIQPEEVQPPPAVSASSSERAGEKQVGGGVKQRSKEEVEQSIAALQRSIHCREVSGKDWQLDP